MVKLVDPPIRDRSTDELMSDLLDHFQGDSYKALEYFKKFIDEPVIEKTPVPRPARQFGEIILSVKNVGRKYRRGHEEVIALAGINLDIRQGEIVAITGASGSGKSTLLQLIGGLDQPTSGEILINGTNIAKLSDKKLSEFRLKTVGFVFQFFYLQPFLKLQDNLEIPGMFAKVAKTARHQRVKAITEKIGLADRLNHYPKELSGGQMQRAATARALLNQPKIILADEPTGNLDSKNGEAIIRLFEDIRDQFDTTIVIITHDEAIAARADRIIRLKDGRIDD